MVHANFVRKQLSIYVKIILVAICVVYPLSILGKLISGPRRRTQIPERLPNGAGFVPTPRQNGEGEGANQELSLLSRWTSLAQNIFGKAQGAAKTLSELRGSLNVHRWYSICGKTIDNLRRHVLFPRHPKLRTSITLLRMRTKLRDFGQRIFGYIHPPLSGTYQFSISSDDFSEVWLSSDETPNNTNLICQVGGLYRGSFIMGFTRPGEFDKYESQTSQYIYLDGEKKYFFEVLHKQGQGHGHLHVAWKLPGWKYFTIITSEFISLFMKEELEKSLFKRDDYTVLPEMILKHHKHVRTNYQHSSLYRNYTRLPDGSDIPLLRHSHKALPACMKSTRVFLKKLKRYQGRQYTQIPSVFPEDGSNLVVQICQSAKSGDECKGNPSLEKGKAYDIAEKYLTVSFPGKYFLKSVIRLEKVFEKHTHNYRYFIEIEVVDKASGEKSRIAEHVVEDHVDGKFCHPTKASWYPDVTVYVIITVKNQGIWLRHFVDNMVDIQEQTNDENIHPIIVDFGSEDVDIDSYLQHSRLKHHTVIHKKGRFYKTAAINEAAASVKNNNSIIFQVDLHLDLPINLIQTVRKHTIQGDLAFVPLLTRLMCGSSPDFPTGHWEQEGYGLFAIYKSDWIRFGGMNEREFSNHWGGEDWEMVDRVIMHNIQIQKLKMPGLFHFFHNRRGMWEKSG